ncbi:MAG TPA: hypothetical protein PLQ80_10615, partial [Candidatus Syntrophosphaera sp.]|nr:hypothetical protein [Candidatus Syntrophosphaera sp.]
ILPLLLLVAFGMLAAVESDPSNVVGYVKYPCVFGDNFVAMPMVDGATIVSEFALPYNGSDDINTVQLWDPVGQGWAACTNYGGNFFDPDLPVGPGTPVFLNTYTAFDYYSIGDLPATNAQYTIVFGDNTVMIPLNKSNLTLVSEVGASIGPNDEINTIQLWDPVGQGWAANTNYGGNFFDPDPAVTIGTPLFLNDGNGTIVWPPSPRGENLNSRISK